MKTLHLLILLPEEAVQREIEGHHQICNEWKSKEPSLKRGIRISEAIFDEFGRVELFRQLVDLFRESLRDGPRLQVKAIRISTRLAVLFVNANLMIAGHTAFSGTKLITASAACLQSPRGEERHSTQQCVPSGRLYFFLFLRGLANI